MSRLFGAIRQIGYVVPNLDEAIEHWVRHAGIGPFFRIDHMPLTAFRVRGRELSVDLSVACANSGDMQIELIEQHNPEPSPYKDFLDRTGAGLQHLGVWSSDYDADIARLLGQGHQIAFDGEAAGATRFTYFDFPFSPGDLHGGGRLQRRPAYALRRDPNGRLGLGWRRSRPTPRHVALADARDDGQSPPRRSQVAERQAVGRRHAGESKRWRRDLRLIVVA